MKISDILQASCIRVPLTSTGKTAVITELVDVLHQAGTLVDRDDVLQAVLAREETRSTGIGLGLAVPHGKTRGCRKLTMAIGKPSAPFDFEAIDGRPCSFVVLLASPVDETGPHIQALAGVSRLWQNSSFRVAVLEAGTADEVFDAIARHEQ